MAHHCRGGKAAPAKSSSGGGISPGFFLAILGGIIFCVGVFLWFGNVLGFYRTIPGAGYITGFIGAAIWKYGLNN